MFFYNTHQKEHGENEQRTRMAGSTSPHMFQKWGNSRGAPVLFVLDSSKWKKDSVSQLVVKTIENSDIDFDKTGISHKQYMEEIITENILEQTMTLMQAYDSNSEVWKLGVNAYKLNNIIYAESSVGRTEKMKQLTHDYLQNKLDDLNYLMAIGNLIAENHN